MAGIAGADGFVEVVSGGAGARHQHRAGADFFTGAAVQELYSVAAPGMKLRRRRWRRWGGLYGRFER